MSKRVVALFLAAVTIGVLGDQLLRPVPWGIGATLWILASVGVALMCARAADPDRFPTLAAILGTALLFAAGIAWRDAEQLKGWNVLAVLAALTLGVLQVRGLRLRAGKVFDYFAGTVAAAVSTVAGPFVLAANGLSDQDVPQARMTRAVKGVLFGILITVPVIILFGALLVSADPVFEQLVRRLVDWDFRQIVSHLLVIGFLSWLAVGYLHTITAPDSQVPEPCPPNRRPRLGLLEVGIPLAALTLLFLAFIIVQVRYLFGGEELIRSIVGLTYAEYARRGFFELIALSGLVLPLLLAAEWSVDARQPTTTRIFRVLAAVQLVLVGLIMVSAMERLRLYHDAYGLTESRFYAAAEMAWIAAALAWFGLTVLRGHRERFVFGSLTAGFLVVGVLNLMNPDAVIARANIERAKEGRELDIGYLSLLSADATPTLASALPELAPDARCTIAEHLEEMAAQRAGSSWRSWSLGRSRADRAMAGISSVLDDCRSIPTEAPANR